MMKIQKTKKFYVDAYFRNPGVSGSATLLSAHWPNGRNVDFLVDAGATQGRENTNYYNEFFPFDAKKIKFIILTHGHHDHQGLLPVVVRQGFSGPIFTHYANTELMKTSLYASQGIIDPVIGHNLYNTMEVERTLDQVVGCTTKRILKPDKDIRIVFFTNGHLIGAVVTLVVISCPGEKSINLIFTGDYKEKNVFFNVEIPPKEIRSQNISAIFCESTYGNVDSTNPMYTKCLQENTVKALKEGKTVIYPTHALGKYQEVLFDIKMWKKKGVIPENVSVYADGGTSQDFTYDCMYKNLGIKKIMRNFIPKDVRFVPRSKKKMEYRRSILNDKDPKIIIAPGGMVSYGPVTYYIKNYLQRDDVLVHLLGYCSPESQGNKLLNTPIGENVMYSGLELTKRCEMKITSEKSGHAPMDILLAFLELFPYKKSVVIYHGEKETKQQFREYLLEHLELPEDKIVVSSPDIGVRIEADGIVDQFATNIKELI